MAKITTIKFEQLYSDKSGVEYGVSWDSHSIQLESGSQYVDFPPDKIEWLIECLEEIDRVIKDGEAKHEKD